VTVTAHAERSVAAAIEPVSPRVDLLSFGLWSTAILAAALALPDADWADHLWVVPAIAVEGIVLGWLLVSTRFSRSSVAFLCAGYGAVLILWHAVGLLDGAGSWRERAVDLAQRVEAFLRLVLSGKPSYDTFAFVLAASAVFWGIASIGTWALFKRGRLWPALLVPGVALFLNEYYAGAAGGFRFHLPAFLLLSLALLVRLELVGHRQMWERRGAQVPTYASPQMMQVGLGVSLGLVALAWIGPRLPELPFLRPPAIAGGTSVLEEVFADALAGLRAPIAAVSGGFGDTLRLAAGQPAAEGEVFAAHTLQDLPRQARIYWRARVFDTYADAQWTTAVAGRVAYDPEIDDLPAPGHQGRWEAEFQIAPAVPTMNLVLPAEVAWVDRSTLLWQRVVDGQVVEILGADSVAGEAPYFVRSRVAVPAADELRSAAPGASAAGTAPYLQLPERLSPRVVQLAQEVTVGASNDFDRADAVVSWLRSHIRYRRESPAPPRGADPLEWFLFESREGFCDYYASAAVLMLRAVGVPSRLAVGYAQGDFEPDLRQYVVSAADSHAWPEVFFPGFGWVEFEPTSSEPPLLRETPPSSESSPDDLSDLLVPRGESRLGSLETPGQTRGSSSDGDAAVGREGWPFPAAVLAAFLLGVIAVVVFVALPSGRRAAAGFLIGRLDRMGGAAPSWVLRWSLPPPSDSLSAFRRMAPWPARLGRRLDADATPIERGRALARLVPDHAADAAAIASAYSAERYGGLAPVRGDASRAWRRLRPALYRAGWKRVLASLRPSGDGLRRHADDDRHRAV